MKVKPRFLSKAVHTILLLVLTLTQFPIELSFHSWLCPMDDERMEMSQSCCSSSEQIPSKESCGLDCPCIDVALPLSQMNVAVVALQFEVDVQINVVQEIVDLEGSTSSIFNTNWDSNAYPPPKSRIITYQNFRI